MVDIYPTLAELCGLTAPESLSGVSLAPVLKDPTAIPRQSALTQYASGYSLRTSRYRYTEWGEDGNDGTELYDHESDPHEMINQATRPEHAKVAERMSKLLCQRIADAGRVPQGVEQIRFDNRRRVR